MSTFCRTAQNFVGPNFFIKLIVKLELWVGVIFNHLKDENTQSKLSLKCYECLCFASFHPPNGYFYYFLSDIWSGTLTFFVGHS